MAVGILMKQMRRSHKSAWLCVALVALALPACRKKVPVPAAAPPPIVIPNRTEKPKEPSLPPAPKIQTPIPDHPPVNVEVVAPPPKPPAPVPKRRARARKKAAEVKVAEAPKVEAPKVEAPPAEEPKSAVSPVQLGVILSPEQTRELAKRLDGALERTRSAVVLIEGKLLTKEQTETLDRIRSFVAQAEQTREQDLSGSVSLAERADLLSRDLLDRLR